MGKERDVIAVLVDGVGEELRGLVANLDKHFRDGGNTTLLLFHTGYPLGE